MPLFELHAGLVGSVHAEHPRVSWDLCICWLRKLGNIGFTHLRALYAVQCNMFSNILCGNVLVHPQRSYSSEKAVEEWSVDASVLTPADAFPILRLPPVLPPEMTLL